MRYTLRYTAAVMGVLLSVMCTPSFGDTATSEQEAFNELNKGTYPLTMSADGLWLLHVDAAGNLYRKKIADPKTVESVQIGGQVRVLSASRSGKKVGFQLSNGCVGIASFILGEALSITAMDTKAPSVTWLDKKLSNNTEDCGGKSAIENPNNGNFYWGFSVAMSSDGKLIAIQGDPIKVIDIASQRVVQVVPAIDGARILNQILHMRFVDADRKLLVVSALMGEVSEEKGGPSDMQFAVWDLQKKELFSFHNTKPKGGLDLYDFLWGFSEITGELWTFVNSNGKFDAPYRPHSTNLKQCVGAKQPRLTVRQPSNGPLSFAADPLGRYVAEVTRVRDEKLQHAKSNISIRDSRSDKILGQWPLDVELRSLTASHDGKTLYGITSGQQKSDGSGLFVGGGELKKFDLSAQIAALPNAAAIAWSEQRCLIENETPDAREITNDNQERPRVFEVPLVTIPISPDRSSCDSGRYWNKQEEKWRQLDDGTLFIDRWSVLEQIDPENGHVLRRFPTPRSDSICSWTLFEQRQFLNWQGDSITLRPFSETVTAADRTVLVKKPGWTAQSLELFGNRFGVRWINNRYKNEKAKQEEISAMAIVYDMSGKQLAQIPWDARNRNFPGDDMVGSVFDKYAAKPQQQGTYRWEQSYVGSIRAYRRDTPTSPEKTVLWSGLRFDQNLEAKQEWNKSWVKGLGGSIGTKIRNSYINVYDAEIRHRLAQIKMQDVLNIGWNPINRMLIVVTGSYDEGGSKLIAYRIE